MKNKNGLIVALALVVTVAAWGFFHHKAGQQVKASEPQQSAEEVLAERAKQASSHLNSALGKAVTQKDWAAVEKLYNPKSQYFDLAEIVRALFIENKMKDFTPADQDKLLHFSLLSLDQMEEKNFHLSGLLITQIERLPSPPHDSANYRLLKKYLLEAKTPDLKKRVSLVKLALQDVRPDVTAMQIFRNGLVQGPTYGLTRDQWIQLMGDTRSPAELQKSEIYLLANFKKIPNSDQPTALSVLSRNPGAETTEIKTIALQFFKSDDLPHFEASLRAISNLASAKLIKSPEKEGIVKKLTSLPLALRSPFATAKASELLGILAR